MYPYYGFGFSWSYWLLIIVTMLIGMVAQGYVRSTFNKWNKVPLSSGLTGAQTARAMLDREGLNNVPIAIIQGGDALGDFYDPRSRTLNLSEDVYNGRSVAATAVACHEAGHAVQHAHNYAPVKARDAIVPLAQISSYAWFILILIGALIAPFLIWVGVALFCAVLLFQLVTLPVEFDASRRALVSIEAYAAAPGSQEYVGSKAVLRSAALTYVAAALASVLQLLYILGIARRN